MTQRVKPMNPAGAPVSRVEAPLGRRRVKVVAARSVGGYRFLEVYDSAGPKPMAGQFYMLAAPYEEGGQIELGRPFLPRAFSVCTAAKGRLGFLIEGVGPGSRALSAAPEGGHLNISGPFGRGFTYPEALAGEGALPVLVAGGVGIPPICLWEAMLLERGDDPVVLAGFRTGKMIEAAELFQSRARIVSEDDAGIGGIERGLVTDLLEERLKDSGNCAVYACGPPPMLEAVRRMCAERDIRAELAMEAVMACGFGACNGCVVKTKDGFVRLCLEGPVMDVNALSEATFPG